MDIAAASITFILPFAVAAVVLIAGSAFLFVQRWLHSNKKLQVKITELQSALENSLQQCVAERKGRIRAQQELRKVLVEKDPTNTDVKVYPMTPIGIIQTCFSTRNGTPRQPLLVPLARACLALTAGGVPQTIFDGLAEYSHCWLLYVFHSNTDLPRLWKQPAHRDFKAKVRVPRLDGRKLGVYATRSPHRPCPIGLTVAKVEGVYGSMLLLSGIDLVDGTPVLDVKPYLPYCDSIRGARTPTWVKADGGDDHLVLASVEFSEGFLPTLLNCWAIMGKQSMYSSPEELQTLIGQVLARDIRSMNQRQRPHNSILSIFYEADGVTENCNGCLSGLEVIGDAPRESSDCKLDNTHTLLLDVHSEAQNSARSAEDMMQTLDFDSDTIVYHLILEGISISYTLDCRRVMVHSAELSHNWESSTVRKCNYGVWAQAVESSFD